MRASDADRERVAAILRRHFEAGRLDDDDLEHRLTRVLAARTLGQLRDQVSDLPAPPPSLGVRVGRGVRYGGRSLRHPAGIVGVIFLVLVVIGAIAGNDDKTSSASQSASPTFVVPSVTAYPSPPAEKITSLRPGALGVDDGMAVRLRRIHRAPSVGLQDEGNSRMFAGSGHEYAIVDVDYSNRLSKKLEPFCGQNGAKLYSRAHFGYELVDKEYEMVGNDAICGGGIDPGETSTAHLLFDVPKGTRLAWIDLWNGDDPHGDVLGNTRLRVHLDGVPGA